MSSLVVKICKHCKYQLRDCLDEGLVCRTCSAAVHVRCLRAGSVPSKLHGDVFYRFTCECCTASGNEEFVRERVHWYKAMALVFYHLQERNPNLGRNGFFHFRKHVVSFIDEHWNDLFTENVEKKARWQGTVVGNLSQYNGMIFKTDTSSVKKSGWWALMYPKLSPKVIGQMHVECMSERVRHKTLKLEFKEDELFRKVLQRHIKDRNLLVSDLEFPASSEEVVGLALKESRSMSSIKRKSLPSSSRQYTPPAKAMKVGDGSPAARSFDFGDIFEVMSSQKTSSSSSSSDCQSVVENNMSNRTISSIERLERQKRERALLQLRCHFNTAQRYEESNPPWLQLMDEIKLKATKMMKTDNYKRPARDRIEYVYIHEEHIPAINSLCNQFFWPGIDVVSQLNYPEFGCVVMYRRLVVAFALVIPAISHTENYMSFMFVRPMWRNVGIAQFMLYHLLMIGHGRDLTLHVSINNPAMILYQKFGFKVESLDKDFYDKFLPNDSHLSKHAFYMRLERS